jgi:hypothetical protein
MKNAAWFLMNWLLADPRRTLTVIFVAVMVVTLALAIVPGGSVLAEDITSGSHHVP